MLIDYFDFEKEIEEIDMQISELNKLNSIKSVDSIKSIDYSEKIRELEKSRVDKLEKIYSNLTPWQVVSVARHKNRPVFRDYLDNIVKDFCELHGDRTFGDDYSIITGLGKIGKHKVLIIGQNKGKTIKEKTACNFGYTNPEGYRKALCKMKLAEKFEIPVLSFIDTPGAYPGIGAEERGQARAIAVNLREMSRLKVPIISIIIGEGGSGGALGIGVGDRMAMLEFAYYSVIAPEACSAILWRNRKYAPEAAEALKLTSKELYKLGLIDEIIVEPLGGAHRDYHDTFFNVENYITKTLNELGKIKLEELLSQRYEKLRKIGKIES